MTSSKSLGLLSKMADTAEVDEDLIDVLRETDLLKFQTTIVFDKQLTRIEHFQDVTNAELVSYGLSEPAVRRLRNAIDRKRKKRTKIFGGARREKATVQLKRGAAEVGQNGFEFPSQPHLIPKNEVLLMETLGEGNFSVVKRALWSRTEDTKMECAVKILHDMSETIRQDLAAEISTMQRLRHQNLVQLFGVVFSDQMLMVMEFCEGGSLLNRLRSQSKPRLLVTTLLNYAQQIANGMSYLESRKCVHRDLAARNVLLMHEEQVVKICDFGLTRVLKDSEHLYIMEEPKKIPFSWSPPESLRFREFSHKSDVWAFGVTLWELFTFGEEPWAGHRAAEVLHLIETDHRLRMPDFCSREIYDIMSLCWQKEAELRPKFSHLRTLLIDCKFMSMLCRVPNAAISKSQMNLSVGDELLLIGQRDDAIWYGQSVASRRLGEFLRTNVSMKSATQPSSVKSATNLSDQRKDISRPIPGSFIHSGHGDLRENKCWGHVDHIDEIYLKNPFTAQNPNSDAEQKVTIVPSILMFNQKNGLSPVRNSSPHFDGVEPSLPSSNFSQHANKLPINAHKSSFDDDTLTVGSRTSATPTLNEFDLHRHSTAIEWLFDEKSQTGTFQHQKRSPQTNGQFSFAPPQHHHSKSLGNGGGTSIVLANSKFDSTISIPRPNRTLTNRLTPPPICAGNFVVGSCDGGPPTISTFLEPKMTAVSSMPSVLLPPYKTTIQTENNIFSSKPQRPTSTHSLNGGESSQKTSKSTDDPFLVEDDVKILASKLRYNNVHKANEFLVLDKIDTKTDQTIPLTERTANDRNLYRARQQQISNVAVVLPFMTSKVSAESEERSKSANSSKHSPIKIVGSLLPPPSDLLLSGLGSSTQKRTHDHLQFQPLFDISGHHVVNGMEGTSVDLPTRGGSCLRYGTNGIPILEPVPASTDFDNMSMHRTNGIGRQETAKNTEGQNEAAIISLSELDTDALINRVKASANFASLEHCRQILWRNGFDVDAAVKQLKIEKLVEMGLATDQDLAASALDSEKWDVNAAANRLCCS
ncbi:hypothetical protein GPALN_003689 [Globodera pallida]|nr:hypothetical protein GPALN_003689 [Globodera pallida]